MSEKEITQGLNCPRCGGMVPIPEGQVIVRCRFCDLRSLVRGERGLRRYQIPCRISHEQAQAALLTFLSRHSAIARDARQRASLDEAMLVFLPFWGSWVRILGWVFGQKRVGSGDDARYEPREVQVAQEATWNGAACDVGEFGVTSIPLEGRPLEAFDPQALHSGGMVFEPVGSVGEARQAAEAEFNQRVSRSARLDRVGQVFVRLARQRFGLVYYPLWVLRYLYRGRAFQVSVDGFSGEVLYGKAPGDTLYRAAVLVGGMALGALLAVDGSALLFYLAGNSDGDSVGGLIVAGLVALVAGLGGMGAAYRKFRHGEQFEFRRGGVASVITELFQTQDVLSQLQDLDRWIKVLR